MKLYGEKRGHRTRRGAGWCAILLVIVACAAFSRGADWRHTVLDAGTFDAPALPVGFRVLPDGGPDGGPTLEFADAEQIAGSIEFDLSGVDLETYDQLHFDLWLENDVANITATLRGFPEAHRGRRWYAMKRFQPLGTWTDIRLDLNMDDDLSGTIFDEPRKSLTLALSRPETVSGDFTRVRVHQVRLVRSPVSIALDYRESSVEGDADGMRFTYPVHLENRTDRPLAVRLDILPETLDHFVAQVPDKPIELAAGERRTVPVALVVGPVFQTLPSGHVERAQVRVTVPAIPGFDAVPIRGYRPVYLFGIVPPAPDARRAAYERIEAAAARMSADPARYADALRWQPEKPPTDVAPAHPAGFRCPVCRSMLDMDALGVAFCYSRDIEGRCERHHERFDLTPDHPLYRTMLHNYHSKSSRIAHTLALAWLRTNDRQLAEKSLEILEAYQAFYRDLPRVARQSTGFQSRFCSASLFERHFLENMVQAWWVLRETGVGNPRQLAIIGDQLLTDSLHIVNFHSYGFSASQIDMTTQALNAGVILEKWPYVADAIGGDTGVQRILVRNFTADGVPIDGGDYARQAARQILTLADVLRVLGIAVEESRIAQIEYHCKLLGYLPRPEDFVMRTTVLEHTGFTILVNGEGPLRRRVTVNWGSSRERGGYDQLTTVFFDAEDRELLMRTRRVGWGHPHANLAFQSFAQNIPVVDEGNITRARLRQEALHDDVALSGVILSDHPERPAYPDSRLKRALLVFNGCLLVLDRVVSSAGERQFDFPVNGLMRLTALPEDLVPFEGPLGEASVYGLPFDLHTRALRELPFQIEWSDADRGVKLHMIGEDFCVFAGRTFTGQHARSVERDFLMFRARGEAVTAAFLYESTVGDHPRIKRFERVAAADADGRPAGESQALAYDVAFSDGKAFRLLISLDGGAYRAGEIRADGSRRMVIRESR